MNNQAFRDLVNQHSTNGNKSSSKNKKNSSSSNNGTSNTINENSTSKEIARYAVEEEFKEIKKKRKLNNDGFDGDFNASDDDGGGSDDDDGNGNDSSKSNANRKNDVDLDEDYPRNGKRKKKNKKNDESDGKYRDRAKERREGKNLDYQATENISLPVNTGTNIGIGGGTMITGTGSNNNAARTTMIGATNTLEYRHHEMTKYLGGDEEFTHLVKGLDKSLADKVRREEMRGKKEGGTSAVTGTSTGHDLEDSENIDLDQIMEDAKALKAKNEQKLKELRPKTTIQDKISSSSSLVSSMASYIQKMEARKASTATTSSTTPVIHHPPIQKLKTTRLSAAGETIHYSTLKFSLNENHHDMKKYSWEIPKESIRAKPQQQISTIQRGDENVLLSTCTPLDSNLILKIKSVLEAASNKKIKREKVKESYKRKAKLTVKKQKEEVELLKRGNSHILEEDDSDDDIYGNIGDYVPTTKVMQ
jgi:hypothetical protein